MASHTLDIVLGNAKKSSAMSDEDLADGGSDDAAEEDTVSAAAVAAWEEYDAEPSAEKFSRAVKAAMGAL